MITNTQSGTNIEEVADGIYRINTPVAIPGGPGKFSFNQYLIVDDAPMLFHTGQRQLFPLVQAAIATVLPVERLRYIGLSHFEADECGSLNSFLAAAPEAVPVCSQIAGMVAINDFAERPPRVLADDEDLTLGRHVMHWFDTPHTPHSWECGLIMDMTTRTFFCGDLFTQGGSGEVALTESDILGPSESFRLPMDYLHTRLTPPRFWNDFPASGQQRWPACTAAHGAAMERDCCASFLYHWPERQEISIEGIDQVPCIPGIASRSPP